MYISIEFNKYTGLRALRLGALVLTLLWGLGCGQEKALVHFTDAWVQEAPPTQKILAAYVHLVNDSDEPIVLKSVESSVAEVVEFHQTSHQGGVMQMRQVEQIEVPAKGQVKMQPGGLHLMLFGVEKPPKVGDLVPLILHFDRGGPLLLQVEVRRLGGGG